jgi:hypothetical protein
VRSIAREASAAPAASFKAGNRQSFIPLNICSGVIFMVLIFAFGLQSFRPPLVYPNVAAVAGFLLPPGIFDASE